MSSRKFKHIELDLHVPMKRNYKMTLAGDTESEEEGFKLAYSTPISNLKRVKTSQADTPATKDGGESMTSEKSRARETENIEEREHENSTQQSNSTNPIS